MNMKNIVRNLSELINEPVIKMILYLALMAALCIIAEYINSI
jgi:hypothetical protein